MSILAMLNRTVDIRRPRVEQYRNTGDHQYNYMADDCLIESAVPCAIQPASANLRSQYLMENLTISHEVFFDQDYGIKPSWMLVLNNRWFRVEGIQNDDELDRLWWCVAMEQPNLST